MRQDIICMAFPSWNGDYMKAAVQLMTQLGKKHRVLYVDYTYTYKDVLKSIMKKTSVDYKKVLGWKNRLRKVKTGDGAEVYVFTPPAILPVNWINNAGLYNRLQKMNARLVSTAVNKVAKKLDFNNPVLVNAFNPFMGVFQQGAFNEKLTIYYCYDEISAARWAARHGERLEHQYLNMTDAVITTSSALYKSKKELNSNTFEVKNGVNYKLFNTGFHPLKEDRTTTTVGYIGSLDDRLDYALLEEIIKANPSFQFQFIGRQVVAEAGSIRQFSNVNFIGAQQPENLPGFIKSFDLGIIPFVKNEFTKNIYPLKINEYLAAGLPVVMTDFADLSDFTGKVKVADGAAEFSKAIHRELATDNLRKKYRRCRMAEKNSWEARAKEFDAILQKMLVGQKIIAA